MAILLSPAKTLNFHEPDQSGLPNTIPSFTQDADILVQVLQKLNKKKLRELLKVSENLATLNFERFRDYAPSSNEKKVKSRSKKALLAFEGQAYQGLDAKNTLDTQDLLFAQKTLCMLDGLYGVLRPFDLIQPYRMEMHTKVVSPQAKNLYEFWGDRITEFVKNQALQNAKAWKCDPFVINVASNEYAKVVDFKALVAAGVPVYTMVFRDGGRIIAVYAKKARGLMVQYFMHHRIHDPKQLQKFDLDGYQYSPAQSSEFTYVFLRPSGGSQASQRTSCASSKTAKKLSTKPKKKEETPPATHGKRKRVTRTSSRKKRN